ncbi:uncharacterized, partial [Tachysurus ichikawai]
MCPQHGNNTKVRLHWRGACANVQEEKKRSESTAPGCLAEACRALRARSASMDGSDSRHCQLGISGALHLLPTVPTE